MSTTTASIAAMPKTENTGITPELARSLYATLGTSAVAIVELRSSERTEGVDHSHKVKLEIKFVEPADDLETEDYLRELQRALYIKRNPQPALTSKDITEPGVDGLLLNGTVHLYCPNCDQKWNARGVAHSRGTVREGYPPCAWTECGHATSTHPHGDCQPLDAQLELASQD